MLAMLLGISGRDSQSEDSDGVARLEATDSF